MVKDVSAYVKSTVSEVQAVLNSDRTTNGPDSTVASKTVKSIALVKKGGGGPKNMARAVRQLTIQQKNTKHATGTLPLNTYKQFALILGGQSPC